MQPWYQVEASIVLHQHGTDAAHGLSTAEAARRLIQHGNRKVFGGTTSLQTSLQDATTQVLSIRIVVVRQIEVKEDNIWPAHHRLAR
jgi:Cation transporter/ATPase, N-terminus